MKDIKIIFGHAMFYGEVALKSFLMFLSYTLLLVFYPITMLLGTFNNRTLDTTQWPASTNVDMKSNRRR